jgi:DNA-binding CsgD family transcriptional regulator
MVMNNSVSSSPVPRSILTPGQIHYLQLVGDGLTQSQVALAAGRSRATVYRLLNQARERLGAETLPQAIAIAALLGLIHMHIAVWTADGKILGYTQLDLERVPNKLPVTASKRIRARGRLKSRPRIHQ